MGKRIGMLIAAAVMGVLVVGCGGGGATTTVSGAARRPGLKPDPWFLHGGPSPMVDTRRIVVTRLPHLGQVVIDGHGHTLYVFVPGSSGAVCGKACAAVWPPFTLTPEHVLDSSPTLSEELISVSPKERRPEGTRVVSYGGRVLHSYAGDTKAWVANGEGLSSYGGHWYVVGVSGKPVTKAG